MNNYTRYLLVIAGLGGLLYGIDFGAIAAAMPYIKALKIFTDAQVSVIVGAVMFGGILSSLSAGVLCETLGRKKMIIAAAAMFLVAIPIVCLSAGSLPVMLVGRVLQGMSAGYMAVVMPMYLTETLPADVRGRGTGIFQFFLWCGLVGAALTGLAVAHFLGAFDSTEVSDASKALAWKINFWWTMIPVALLFAGGFFLKESPVWLERKAKGGSDGTRTAPVREKGSLLRRKYVIPFLLAVAVLTLNKTMGMSSITSYAVVIFNKAGFTGQLGNFGDFAIKLVSMVTTLVAASLVDRKGRTWLLKVGTAGMTVGLFSIGAVLLAVEKFGVAATTASGCFCLVAFFVMEVFYSLGPGICVWLVLSELMPSRIRANGMAIALFMNQLTAWGLASSFLPWVNAWGWYSMFFFFAANGALYFVVACLIPETKGKSLEELEHLFDRK